MTTAKVTRKRSKYLLIIDPINNGKIIEPSANAVLLKLIRLEALTPPTEVRYWLIATCVKLFDNPITQIATSVSDQVGTKEIIKTPIEIPNVPIDPAILAGILSTMNVDDRTPHSAPNPATAKSELTVAIEISNFLTKNGTITP